MTWFTADHDPRLFRCPCLRPPCDAPQPTAALLEKLERARELLEQEIIVSSGVRCAWYNAQPRVGGARDSEHVTGEAADLVATSSRYRFRLRQALLAAGFVRIGTYKGHLHVDVGMDKPQDVEWLG